MIGPRVSDEQQREYCVYNIHLPGPFGFTLNCDSPDLLLLAHNPRGLLQEGNVRQDRPTFVLGAFAISKLFFFKKDAAINRAVHFATVRGKNFFAPIYFFKYYLAYIIINILILLCAFSLFRELICREEHCYFFQISLAFLLIFNDVVKAFIWSPHTQMFNIMLPLFCLWCFVPFFVFISTGPKRKFPFESVGMSIFPIDM